jgi:mRNA interferase MazF
VKTPRRGEVWLVDLGMAAKVRAALVISETAEDIDRALVTLVPHTTSVRGSRFEVSVRLSFLRPGTFDAQNLITVPHARLVRELGRLNAEQLGVVEQSVRRWLRLVANERRHNKALEPTPVAGSRRPAGPRAAMLS